MEFDWPRILKGQGGPEPAPPAVRIEQERRKRPRDSRPPRAPEPSTPANDQRAEDAPPAHELPDQAVRPDVLPGSEAPVPTKVESVPIPDTIIPAHAILGAEGVQRLRKRYADLAARIASRVQEDEQRQRLKEQSERLNPDTWSSEDDVRRALEQYEAILESIRAVVGQPRRRRRQDEGTEDRGSESV